MKPEYRMTPEVEAVLDDLLIPEKTKANLKQLIRLEAMLYANQCAVYQIKEQQKQVTETHDPRQLKIE